MRKHARLLLVLAILLIAFGVYAAWAFNAGAHEGLGWAALAEAWPYLLAGVATTAVVIAAFLRLAVISHKRGFDDRAGNSEP